MPGATSVVQIINMALAEIGAQAVTDHTVDQSPAARLANRLFDQTRDAILRAHLWNCAMKRAKLTAAASPPLWGFSLAYDLPADFIRLADVESRETTFRVEGRQILTDSSEMNILYVYRLENVALMDESLKGSIATRLALEMSMTLQGSAQHSERLLALSEFKLSEGQFIDQVESPVDTMLPTTWTEARHGFNADFRKIAPAS